MMTRMTPLTAANLLALGCLNVWLLAIVLSAEGPANQAAPSHATWTPKPSDSTGGQSQRNPASAYRETLARPIFYRSREPFVPAPPPPPPAPQSVAPPAPAANPSIALGGVIINGVLRKAYLFSRGSPQGMWVGEGDNFMGWTVAAIDAGSAQLKQAGRTIDVQLYDLRR
jgi:hypothetical protein